MLQTKGFWVYGLATGFATAITSIVIFFSDVAFRPFMHFIVCIPMMAGVVLNGFVFSKSNKGYVTFKQVFVDCLYVAIIAVSMIVFWDLLSFAFLAERQSALIAEKEIQYNSGGIQYIITSDTNGFTTYSYTVTLFRQIYFTLLLGTIFALITAAVVNTSRVGPE